MTWKIKIKGEKNIAEVLSDDLSNAIFKAINGGAKGRRFGLRTQTATR
jgi:hypothetical protein